MRGSASPVFSREMGFSESEWQRALATALAPFEWQIQGPHGVAVRWRDGGASGELHLRWEVLPPRAIALARIPRMRVDFDFGQTPAPVQAAFMRHFDLYTHRGGG
jgi:hypothetical protein